ncbi:TetR family transcriptional regulator [soil metagenome]
MARWQPGAADRLRASALELFVAQGFEQTTAAEIAGAAGVTERTFYRHFDDKREVLFGGQDLLRQGFVEGVATALPDAAPLEVVAAALETASAFFADDRRASSRLRGAVIAANAGLRERELLKMAALAGALTEALRERGVPDPVATLAAESGVTVFRVAFERWIAPDEERSFDAIQRAVLGDLTSLTRHLD